MGLPRKSGAHNSFKLVYSIFCNNLGQIPTLGVVVALETVLSLRAIMTLKALLTSVGDLDFEDDLGPSIW